MSFFLNAIFLSSLCIMSYASSPQKQLEVARAQTISALEFALKQAAQSKTSSELAASLAGLGDLAKKPQESACAPTLGASALGAKAHSESNLPHYQLSVRGNRVRLFYDPNNKLHLLIGKHNDYLAGRRPYYPNELMVLEVDPACKKEHAVASTPLGGDLERIELYTNEQGTKIRTEVDYTFGLCPYREFDALTLKQIGKDEPNDPKTTKGDWGNYSTLHGLFFSLWKKESRYERHVVATIDGKKKRISLADNSMKIVDTETSTCEYEHTSPSFKFFDCIHIHVLEQPLKQISAAAGSAGTPTQSQKDAMIVFPGTDTQYIRRAGAPSQEEFLSKDNVAMSEYYREYMQRRDSLVINIFNTQSKQIEKHVIPDITICCSTRFPDQNGSKIIFACKTDKEKQVYKLLLFDPVTKKHQLFEKIDPTITTYEFDPEDISCITTPEGKSLIALARGSDIFMIDLNIK